ncbi:hypothetical protein S83_019682, partial [Arachis hypogaea]
LWYGHVIAEAILQIANFSIPLKVSFGGGIGILPKGYNLSSLDAFKKEGSLNVQAGTAFVDLSLLKSLSSKLLPLLLLASSGLSTHSILYYVDAEDRESLWTCFCDTNGFPKVAIGVYSSGRFNLTTALR